MPRMDFTNCWRASWISSEDGFLALSAESIALRVCSAALQVACYCTEADFAMRLTVCPRMGALLRAATAARILGPRRAPCLGEDAEARDLQARQRPVASAAAQPDGTGHGRVGRVAGQRGLRAARREAFRSTEV